MPGRIQKCSICKQEGHNRRSCLNNGGNIQPTVQPINPDFNIEEIEYIDKVCDPSDNIVEDSDEVLHISQTKKTDLLSDLTRLAKYEAPMR